MSPVAPRIVLDVSCETRINHQSHFSLQRVIPVAPRIVLDVSRDTGIKHEFHLSWQAQYLVKLEGDSFFFAPCTGRFI